MSRSDPLARQLAAESAAQWCLGLAMALAEAAAQVGRLADRIANDWPDDRGRERAQRTALLHRELGRESVGAAELGSTLEQLGTPTADLPSIVASAARARRGVRLGGTEASRADDERGMRIAQLPDPDGQGG